MKRSRTTLALVLCLAGFYETAGAAGFALIENSASGMGNSFAGAAAVAEDASTIWFNPAGMTLLKQQEIVAALHYIIPSADYTDHGSYVNPALTGDQVEPGSLTGMNDSSKVNGLVPNFYYVLPLSDAYLFGIGVNIPFGMETEYDDDWIGRYHATNSKIHTVNINPSMAWQATDALSLGFGLNVQYAEADLSKQIDSGATCLGLAAARDDNEMLTQCLSAGLTYNQIDKDSSSNVNGDDWSYGYNLGLLYQPTSSIRLGLAYRSAITHDVSAEGKFDVNADLRAILDAFGMQDLLVDSPASAEANLPATASLSGVFDVTDHWTILADITWTSWSRLEELRVVFDNPDQPDSVIHYAWEDSMRYAVALNYRANSYILRTGLAYDETPIPDEQHRTPGIPTNDRTWISIGAGLSVSNAIWLDFGYAHLFSDDAAIDHTDAGNGYTLRGEYELAADILSMQATFQF